jgi:hypothetical protein
MSTQPKNSKRRRLSQTGSKNRNKSSIPFPCPHPANNTSKVYFEE